MLMKSDLEPQKEFKKKFSIPANLLLMGEYAILEEGGKGIALACEPRAYISIKPSAEWLIRGRWGREDEVTFPQKEKDSFVSLIFNYLLESYPELKGVKGFYEIEIDTRSFFDEKGRKKGYGSSAVVALGLTVALFSLIYPYETLPNKCFLPAIEAHRRSQGGKGSGYDIATSLHGGIGIFTGGKIPSWHSIKNFILSSFYLFQGEKPVKTLNAIQSYRKWREKENSNIWLDKVNALVNSFENEPNENFLISILRQAEILGKTLSKEIGVSAELSFHDRRWDSPSLIKALGAGNETFLFYNPPQDEVFTPIFMAREGLRWEI